MRTLIFSFLLLASCGGTEEPKEIVVDDSGGGGDSGSDSGSDLTDADGDGFSQEEDCDDNDATVNPDARETCDGIDNDCDGLFDDEDSNVFGTSTWYLDADADGYGGDSLIVEACDEPDGYVEDRGDCNDLDANSHPGAEEVCDGVDNDCDGISDEDDAADALTWFVDEDGDGYGTTASVETACDPPAGYSMHDGDCDDADPGYHPGASEADCTDPNDYNCDGSVGFDDADSDGFAACEDCDDADADVNDDVVEVCDSVDNDCDGLIDDDDPSITGGTTWYADSDGDGHGGQQFEQVACAASPGFVAAADDCDDLNAASYPGASEICDSLDNDCDGDVDEGVGSTWYQDSDADGYGNGSVSQQGCDAPSGYVSNALDCDDFSAATNPTSYEVCDGADNDCDGDIDEGAINATTWYVDGDSDGYGTMASSVVACDQPTGHAGNATDCDDVDAAVNPGATEACDGTDNDCDGSTDEGVKITYYADTDADGYGDATSSTEACSLPSSGYVTDATDCDDALAATNPGATETCNTVDDDCDGTVDEDDASDASTWYEDGDTDTYGNPSSSLVSCTQPGGYVADATDCDDGSSGALYYPGASESCGDPDYNCDGVVEPTPCPYATVTFTENQGVLLTDYAVRVDISAHNSALSGGFSIADTNGTAVDYCFEVQSGDREGECTSSYTDFVWIKLPSLSSSGTLDLRIYPGSNAAGTGLDVFEVYEDFQDTSAASGISGWSYNHLASGYIGMAGSNSYYVGLNGSGLTSSVHKKIDYYQGVWSAESDLTLWLDGTDYGGDIDIYNCPARPNGARSWTLIKTNEMSYNLCGSSESNATGTFNPSVGSSFEYRHRANDGDASGMTLTWISMRPYVDSEPSSVVTAL